MFVSFVASNAILLVTLSFTLFLSDTLPPLMLDIIQWEWLANIATGSAIGLLVSRSYDVLIPGVSGTLPKPISSNTFSIASLFVVVLLVFAALGKTFPALQNPQAYPEMTVLALLLLGFCAVEVWKTLPKRFSTPEREIATFFLGIVLWASVMLAPAYVITNFVTNYNLGISTFLAGWVAGLSSRQFRLYFGEGSLEQRAAESATEGVFGATLAILFAVIATYIGFKVAGVNPILFSVVAGGLGSVFSIIASTFHIGEH